ncbi:alpha/beta-hydrolase [Dothidotthia symphoricarpi CBS 119687]|uniref:Alpha/beta-hydrolase n=1 Tax=Dothidotthia symphoricarpi CBS 119687 TaxID=1392245 RepID=A0A6A5ZX74_9PLEO|nr:alpha/beta-hydrolase [Dothidotthia symphoricarpi CBS 119687]KAF2123514.1 alpha/beta-hydrolase [Dothidotthia symphoricarpi CBS 119687]
MPVNTLSVSAAVAPTVIETYISHYLKRSPLRQKPTAHISYHEGLELIRRFLHYASCHTVDELQAFTSQWVPVPHWVHVREVEMGSGLLQRSAEHISAQLGPGGIAAVGGSTWWQWRRENTTLKAEWIEMRKDYDARRQLNIDKGQRIMLYVHGGAYYFGSVDEHRYQMQRHARKLKARVLAPRYRLAPQFPFPCGLMDCLAAYLYLLEEKHDPSTIIMAGDSAGGGMVLSLLVTLRDQGIPLPAGAILISPWVDLTHSFPSLGGDGKQDYIPPHGFVHKPSMAWPPPNADDLRELERPSSLQTPPKDIDSPSTSTLKDSEKEHDVEKEAKAERVQGFSVTATDQPNGTLATPEVKADPDTWVSQDGKYSVGLGGSLTVELDGVQVELKDQIQLYAANHLMTHPLVSPALQPSLGGLPPLLITTGGGELLKDEQIYVAHKAANPMAYLPPPSNNQTAEHIQAEAAKYKPTNVQLQVWDDLCHVCPTLSFTRPAKHMYRSIAQFGAWALARAQDTSIDILDDDDISFVSTDSATSSDSDKVAPQSSRGETAPQELGDGVQVDAVEAEQKAAMRATVGRAGDSLPAFEHYMIRQRIDRHGRIYPLAPKEELVALNMPIADIGVPKSGPVNKYMKASREWNNKFAKQKIKIQKQRMKEMEKGFERFDGETPPPTALAGRRAKGMKAEKAKKKSWGMSMWSLWGSKHDQATIVREEKADQADQADQVSDQNAATTPSSKPDEPPVDGTPDTKPARGRIGLAALSATARLRSRSRHTKVTDRGQVGTSAFDLSSLPPAQSGPAGPPVNEPSISAPGIVVSEDPLSPATLIPATDTLSTRPTKGGIAYPFSLKVGGAEGKHVNASTATLQSLSIATPVGEVERQLGAYVAVSPLVKSAGGDEGATQDADAGAGVEKVERPHVERFETAQEQLGTSGDIGKTG